MKNLENQLVFLNAEGAQRLFSNLSVIGLPIIPTDPTLVSDTIVYGDTFTLHNGEYIGGCVSQEAFTEKHPGTEKVSEAVKAYEEHMEMLKDRFGPQQRHYADVMKVMGKPQIECIPTLEERAKRRDEGEAW